MRLASAVGLLASSLGCVFTLAACGSYVQSAATVPASSPASQSPPATSVSSSDSSPSPVETPSPAAASEARAPRCTDSQIAVTLTHTGAITGQVGGYLTFSNTSHVACSLTGWPAVTGVTQSGTSTPVAHATLLMFAAWQLTYPLPVVTVPAGGAAYAALAGDDNSLSGASCPAPYISLQVTIPGGSQIRSLSAWLPDDVTYLPTCLTVTGRPGTEITAIIADSALPTGLQW